MIALFRRRPQLIVPVAIAALLRAGHLVALAFRDPLFLTPVVDAWFHAHQAEQIIERGWLLAGTGAFYKGPFYSYVLAVLFSIFGPTAGVVAARVLSLVLGCVTVFLVARIAERLGDRRAAWIAGGATAVYGTLVYFDVTMLLVPLVTVLLVFAAERLLVAYESASPERLLVVAGALLGLVTITRANALLAVLAAAIWAAAVARSGRWPLLGPLRGAVLVALPALLVVAPVTARNAVVEGDPVVVSWNGGINFFMGNDPAFEQDSGNWHADLAWMRLNDLPRELSLERGSEHQRFFLWQSILRFRRAPLEALGVLLHKAGLVLGAHEISNNRRIGDARERSPVLAVLMFRARWFELPMSLAAPLLAAGLVLWRLRGSRLLTSPLVPLAIAWALTPVLFFNTARFRLPAIVLLIPLAAAGWSCWHALDRRRRRARIAVLAAGVLALAVATLMIPAAPIEPLSDEVNLGEAAARTGDADAQLDWFEKAVAREPENPFARIRLGDQLGRRQRYAEAMPHFETVMNDEGLSADWRNQAARSYARCLLELGRFDEAIEAYERFLARNPDRPRTGAREDFHLEGTPPVVACTHRLELMLAFERSGRIAEAAREASRVLTDCAEVERLAREAHSALERLAQGSTTNLADPKIASGGASPPRISSARASSLVASRMAIP